MFLFISNCLLNLVTWQNVAQYPCVSWIVHVKLQLHALKIHLHTTLTTELTTAKMICPILLQKNTFDTLLYIIRLQWMRETLTILTFVRSVCQLSRGLNWRRCVQCMPCTECVGSFNAAFVKLLSPLRQRPKISYSYIIRLHLMHEMQTIVTDDPGVCLSGGVIWCSFCQISSASC